MKKITAFLLSFLAASMLQAKTIPAPTAEDPYKATVETIVNEMMQKNDIPGVAVLLYIDGQPAAYYFGVANQDKKIPVTEKTIFELGSLSKLMTSILLAQEVDAAKVQLNNSVTDYLTKLPGSVEDITLQNLATHTSGLSFSLPETIHNQAELDKYFEKSRPSYNADEKWIYSNAGIGLLGLALEKATHQSFDELYRTQIALPLHMQPIGLTVPPKLKRNLAQGYDAKGNAAPASKMNLFASAFGVKASGSDMAHFLGAAIGLSGTPERLFYPIRMTQSAYVELPTKDQGLGWQINDLTPDNISELLNEPAEMSRGPISLGEFYEKPVFDGNALIDKTGGTDGFRAYIAVIPNKKSGIVILMNKFVSNAVLVNKSREILFKLTNITPADQNDEYADEDDEVMAG